MCPRLFCRSVYTTARGWKRPRKTDRLSWPPARIAVRSNRPERWNGAEYPYRTSRSGISPARTPRNISSPRSRRRVCLLLRDGFARIWTARMQTGMPGWTSSSPMPPCSMLRICRVETWLRPCLRQDTDRVFCRDSGSWFLQCRAQEGAGSRQASPWAA